MTVGRDLAPGELRLLSSVLARRDPGLIPTIERIGAVPLDDDQRERIRRVVVDELCELPGGSADRRALELEELLIRLGTV